MNEKKVMDVTKNVWTQTSFGGFECVATGCGSREAQRDCGIGRCAGRALGPSLGDGARPNDLILCTFPKIVVLWISFLISTLYYVYQLGQLYE